jgi:hypothetical protein
LLREERTSGGKRWKGGGMRREEKGMGSGGEWRGAEGNGGERTGTEGSRRKMEGKGGEPRETEENGGKG